MRDLLTEQDLQTVPDLILMHLACSCELATASVYRFSHLRCGKAAQGLAKEAGRGN